MTPEAKERALEKAICQQCYDVYETLFKIRTQELCHWRDARGVLKVTCPTCHSNSVHQYFTVTLYYPDSYELR